MKYACYLQLYTFSQSRNLFDRMVSKVEKIKIEDESNGNVSPTIHDTTDNTSTAAKEIDNSFEDDEQVQCVLGLGDFESEPGCDPKKRNLVLKT